MKTEHLFLSCPTVAATGRWVEAFASGESMELPALQVRLRRSAPEHCMIWLSSSDPQWPDHLQQVFHIRPEFRVVVLSNAPDPDEGLNALNRGARGYTHAYAVAALLREVALVVEHGGLWVGAELLQRLVTSTRATLAKMALPETQRVASPVAERAWATLSAREAQVARAVAQGLSNKEVASLMSVSEGTVKAHLGAVFEKLGVRDRLQLVLRLATLAAERPASGEGTLQ